ncbi:unnamed protein product [Mytilus edulis]|uniref:Uncharacterized protein n=1 Tax=Mytilus edulis TaxID=6550 RepID=A0A8S3S8E3_MYTED|nr:unnamed protein product [Mytilus edulis]
MDVLPAKQIFVLSGKYIASPAADAFRSLGGSIAKAGREIIQAISGDVNNIIGNLKGLIGKPFEDFENALKTVGQIVSEKAPVVINAIKDAVLPVWERTLGTLFRRKRCVSSCLSCDKLDVKKYTISWIIESAFAMKPLTTISNAYQKIFCFVNNFAIILNVKPSFKNVLVIIVCGSDTARQKNKAMAEITFLKDMYTKIKDKELITKIEYDLSSNAWSGLMIYMDTFASIGGKLVQQITGDLNISAPVRTGWSIAQQIFDAELDNRQSSPTVW